MKKNNQIRLLILKILIPDYPLPLDSILLRRCLSNFGYPLGTEELSSNLAYLKERGYVKIDEKKGFDITLVSVTANGIDLVDGLITDPGVGADE